MSAALDTVLLDHSSGILLLVDASSLVIAGASKPTLQLLGYRREELVGRRITELECALADVCFWEETLRGGPQEVRGVETGYQCASGDTLRATKTVSRLVYGDRVCLAVRAEPHDLQQRTENALVQTTSRLQAALEATAEGLLLVDRAGRIINMNRRFSRIWGLPDALLAEHDDSLIFAFMAGLMPDSSAYQTKLAAISSQSDRESFDVLPLTDGRVFERRSTPARNAEQIFGRVYSYADITERRRAEAARDQLQAQLRESQKMEALGTLAGGIAHDFNNIVATIMGNVELARQDLGPVHAALESLEEIRKASARAKELVRQILAFGRRQRSARTVIALEPVVTDSARFLRTMLPAGVTLCVDCAAGLPAVLADENQIQQVLLNLCANAWQALQGQVQPGVIRIRLEQCTLNAVSDKDAQWQSGAEPMAPPPSRGICLSVSDNGCGMDTQTRARIFEPFFTTKPVGEGTGLGLSVVHRIVEDHDASIAVHSEPGAGASFRIQFPEARASDSPSLTRGSAPAAPSAPDEPIAGAGTAGASRTHAARILYVDDDESIIFLMTRLLQRQGYRVSGYTDARAAVAAMRAAGSQFDLAITDYNMPGMSGLEVVRALREIRPALPVALASGYITEELRAQALAAGVSELIYKPNTMDELCKAVARLAASLPKPHRS